MASLLFDGILQPTRDDRGWLINPIGRNPWWTVLAASIPALLCTILIFMDQQISAVIVNRKENKLKVGLPLLCIFLLNVSHFKMTLKMQHLK